MEQLEIMARLVAQGIKNTFGRSAVCLTAIVVKCYGKGDFGFYWNVPNKTGRGNQASVNGDKAQKFSTFDDAKRACIVSLNNHFDDFSTCENTVVLDFKKQAGIALVPKAPAGVPKAK